MIVFFSRVVSLGSLSARVLVLLGSTKINPLRHIDDLNIDYSGCQIFKKQRQIAEFSADQATGVPLPIPNSGRVVELEGC